MEGVFIERHSIEVTCLSIGIFRSGSMAASFEKGCELFEIVGGGWE